MSTPWRNTFMAACAAAVLVLVYLFTTRSQERMLLMANRTIQSNNITKQWLDEHGHQVTASNSNYVTSDELRHSTDRTIDSVRKALAGPVKNLERVTRVLTTRLEHLTLPVHDTTVVVHGQEQKGFSFRYSSEWMPHLSGLLVGDSLHLDYELKGGYALEYHWEKTGLFKPQELSVLVTSLDPAVKVDNVQTFSVVQPVPWFKRPGVTLAAGFVSGLVVHTWMTAGH